jgi:hypothetical protein
MRARDAGIVTRPRFAFANKPGRYQGQVAAKLANDLSPATATKRFGLSDLFFRQCGVI